MYYIALTEPQLNTLTDLLVSLGHDLGVTFTEDCQMEDLTERLFVLRLTVRKNGHNCYDLDDCEHR